MLRALGPTLVGLGLLAVGAPSQLYPAQIQPLPIAESFGGASTFAVCDVDEDGISDVVSRLDPATLRVSRGDGLGHLLSAVLVAAPDGSIELAADVTGDGHVDLVLHEDFFSELHVLPGDGAGGFGSEVVLAVPSPPACVVGDVDEDGIPDLVAAAPGGLHVFRGDGAGGFAAPTQVPVSGLSFPSGLVLDHLDADAHLDVAVGAGHTSASGPVDILLGDGNGGFTLVSQISIGNLTAVQLMAGDLDGDTQVDLVARGVTSNSSPVTAGVSVLLGDGTGAFTSTSVLASGHELSTVFLLDDDHDGDLDLYVRNPWPGAIGPCSVRLANVGAGAFGAPETVLPDGLPFPGRFDGDAFDDVAVFSAALGTPNLPGVALIRGRASGGFESPVLLFEAANSNAVAADVNGDRHLDVLSTGPGTTFGTIELRVWPGDGAGGFGAPLSSPSAKLSQVVAGDLDHDGQLDAIGRFSIPGYGIAVALGDGTGRFGPPTSFGLVDFARDLAVADMTGDGKLDVVAVVGSSGLASLVVLPGDGHGALGTPIVTPSPSLAGGIALGDLDHDGDLDVCARTTGAGALRVFLGNGAGGVTSVADYPASPASTVRAVTVADVNLDGHADVLTGHEHGELSVRLGDGTGALPPPVVLPTGSGSLSESLAVADVSGDGLPDVVVPRDQLDRYAVLLGDGAGGFTLQDTYGSGGPPSPVVIADFDGDQRPDIVGALASAVAVALHRETGFTWKDLGQGLASGPAGPPKLGATGSLVAGQPVKLVLSGARPLAPGWLVVGLSQLGLPFKGGTLVPNPDIVLLVQTDALGSLILQGPLPPGTPSGLTRSFQYWILDPAGPVGLSASNALAGEAP